MTTPASRRPALQDIAAGKAGTAVRLTALGPATRLVVRGRDGVAAAAAPALGLALPTEVCRVATGGDLAALWLSPDEWLVIASDGRSAELAAALDGALAALPHAVVDVSHRNVGLELSGPQAAYVLNHGSPLDLSLTAFPVGMCTRTLFGKSEIILWRTAAETFRIEVWRSFSSYVAGLLQEAARELEG